MNGLLSNAQDAFQLLTTIQLFGINMSLIVQYIINHKIYLVL